MTDKQKLDEIVSLFTFLQRYIQNNIDQSFTDLTFDLEALIKDYLNIFEKVGEKYDNVNQLKHNYPAIDLVNKTKDIALQVTTNADLKKVRKTIDTYNLHKLTYKELIVIGFVKATKQTLSNVKVHDLRYLIDLAKYGSSIQKDEVYEILKRRIPWNSLTPLDDKLCFDIVFDVIDRSAVRDYTICEGDFNKMVDGLYEVKEIITTGNIKGKPIRAKALVEYSDKVKRQLSEIEFNVSQIIQICNSNKNQNNSTCLYLTKQETDDIDDLKEKIILKTNRLANDFGLSKQISGSSRR